MRQNGKVAIEAVPRVIPGLCVGPHLARLPFWERGKTTRPTLRKVAGDPASEIVLEAPRGDKGTRFVNIVMPGYFRHFGRTKPNCFNNSRADVIPRRRSAHLFGS
jgi:hypothetical protein